MDKVIDINGIVVEKSDPFFEMWMGFADNSCFASDDFLNEVKDLKSGDSLRVDVFTDGGNIDAGIRIYNECKELQRKGVKVTTRNLGKQHSIGNIIMLGGTERLAFNSSTGLIHLPRISGEYFWQFMGGVTSDQLEVVVSDLKLEEDRMLDIYVAETGANRDALKRIMHDEKTLSAKQLKQLNFITEFIDGEATAAPKAANLVYSNKFMFNLKKQGMDKAKFSNLKKLMGEFKNLLMGEVVNLDFATQEGGTLMVEREDGEPAVGDAATIDGSADGECTLEDGTKVVVTAGVITAITPPADDELDNLRTEVENLRAENAALKETINASNLKMAEIENVIADLEGVHTNFKPSARQPRPAAAAAPRSNSSKSATADERKKLRGI